MYFVGIFVGIDKKIKTNIYYLSVHYINSVIPSFPPNCKELHSKAVLKGLNLKGSSLFCCLRNDRQSIVIKVYVGVEMGVYSQSFIFYTPRKMSKNLKNA